MCTEQKNHEAQEMKWEENPLSFEASSILIFFFATRACIIRAESPSMIHEKLKATNSNEFIIEDMGEIFNENFSRCDKQRMKHF